MPVMKKTVIGALAAAAAAFALLAGADPVSPDCQVADLEHGGGLNACGCHFNRKTGECHCHQPRGCGCPCQPVSCR